jgi:hypothetical protein
VKEVRAAHRAGKITIKEASRAIADLAKDGSLEDVVELILEAEAATEQAADREGAGTPS